LTNSLDSTTGCSLSSSTYHSIALDLLPEQEDQHLRILDLGCGTAEFLKQILERRPLYDAVAIDYSTQMLEQAALKPGLSERNVTFLQRDLNDGIPEDIGQFDLVSSFSAPHHLRDENKRQLLLQVAEHLKPGGRFLFMDAMFEQYDDDVFRQTKNRELNRRTERLSGVAQADFVRLEEIKESLSNESPERDRFSSLHNYKKWMDEAGFASVNHMWHFWMEHLFVCVK